MTDSNETSNETASILKSTEQYASELIAEMRRKVEAEGRYFNLEDMTVRFERRDGRYLMIGDYHYTHTSVAL